MKNKAPLALMELTIMLAVFALAAALCLQAFSTAERISRESETLDRAVLLAQNAAEELKSGGEAAMSLAFSHHYDDPNGVYVLTFTPIEQTEPLLIGGHITVTDGSGRELVSLPVAAQREVPHG